MNVKKKRSARKMTDVNCLTSEHTTRTTTTVEAASLTTPTKNVLEQSPTSPFILRAPPSAKSKLILQNMEEVLNSVKQKHREKHKRKREEKRRAAMRAEAEAEGEATKKTTTSATTTSATTTASNGRHVLREKTTRENGIGQAKRKSHASPLKSSTPQTTIMKHFAKAATPAKAATNVFELMMNARNRALGTNANGQAAPEQAPAPVESTDAETPQTKRRQLLQEWNERKGGAKRRLADNARGEYIEQQMEQRAKRLKKMLTQPTETSEPSRVETTQPASAPVKRGRGRPRTRRLSADVEVTPETVEFLAKLSSPTKKRDSLLGYFAKLESPKEETLETPKRRPRATKSVASTPATVEQQTPSARPRRSCAAKARYDYDLEPSPSKVKSTAADDSIEIIELDSSNPATTPKKLAPLFVRQLPKPGLDPTVLRARQEFLHSGVPEKLRQEQQRQRCFEQYYEESYELFPRIAHVGGTRLKTAPKPAQLRAEDKDQDQEEEVAAIGGKGRISSCTAADFAANQKRHSLAWTPLPLLDNKRALVKNWKSVFDRFPTFKCYNQMREKYRHFSAIDAAQDTQPMGESFVVTRRTRRTLEQQQQHPSGEQTDKPPALAPNGELLFTEKYKPLLFEQVLVNLTPVQELRDFLSNWNGNRSAQPASFDDSSLDHDSSSMGASCNTMVLLGPCSSGKTNAVFALANDMNFNVLEINAGMRRTGKKLMQELQEATQSHQIRKEAKGQQLLQKQQLNGLKDVRKSLILIEDADILFENTDAGFTDAIYTLAASSKRPVIIVASDPNCAHLQRLMQQNTIRFQAPNALNISRFLAVLALMENCPIELDDLISLYLYNDQNLRKTLMELQFFIQSGGDGAPSDDHSKRPAQHSPPKSNQLATLAGVHIHRRLFEFYATAQNEPHSIPFPVDFRLLRHNLTELLRHATLPSVTSSSLSSSSSPSPVVQRRSGKRKSCSPKKAWLSNATHSKTEAEAPLQTLAAFYEQLSTAALLDARLAEQRQDCLQPHLGEQLAHSLVEGAISTCLASKGYAYSLFDKPKQRHNLADQLGSCYLRTRCARDLDYEPAMRAICRSEKQRAGLERRSSRFYHYLRNTVASVTSFSTELYDAACQVLQEHTEQDPVPATSTELAE